MSLKPLTIAIAAAVAILPSSRAGAQPAPATQPPAPPVPLLSAPGGPTPVTGTTGATGMMGTTGVGGTAPMTFTVSQPPSSDAPALTDSDYSLAVSLLSRIQTLASNALGVTPTDKADKATQMKKERDDGTVGVDRASLDEIRSLADQVAALIPQKRR